MCFLALMNHQRLVWRPRHSFLQPPGWPCHPRTTLLFVFPSFLLCTRVTWLSWFLLVLFFLSLLHCLVTSHPGVLYRSDTLSFTRADHSHCSIGGRSLPQGRKFEDLPGKIWNCSDTPNYWKRKMQCHMEKMWEKQRKSTRHFFKFNRTQLDWLGSSLWLLQISSALHSDSVVKANNLLLRSLSNSFSSSI